MTDKIIKHHEHANSSVFIIPVAEFNKFDYEVKIDMLQRLWELNALDDFFNYLDTFPIIERNNVWEDMELSVIKRKCAFDEVIDKVYELV